MLFAPAVYLFEKETLQALGDRTAAAAADGAAVDFANRRHFGSGAGEERLVRDIHLVARETPHLHLETALLGQTDHGVARDAVERGGEIGRYDFAAAHDENILAAAFRDVAFGVEQQRLVGAGGERVVQREHRVDVVAVRLGAAHRDVDVMAIERGGAHANAVLDAVFAEVSAPVP